MSDEYNMPSIGLFGRRCRILHGYDKRPFVYRIVNSEIVSNAWCEPPLTYQSERNVIHHDHSEPILIVVCDTLIDENSKLTRVALKDVELMPEPKEKEAKTGHWISVEDGDVVTLDFDGSPERACFCSECKEYLMASDEYAVSGKYCPCCGAKMEGR